MTKISSEITISISKNFNIPINKVEQDAEPFIRSLFVYILHSLIIKNMDNGKYVAENFLINIGKSEKELNDLYDLYGEDGVESEASFAGNLKYHLGLIDNLDSYSLEELEKMDASFYLYYLRIKSACESILKSDIDEVELKNGFFDYSGDR